MKPRSTVLPPRSFSRHEILLSDPHTIAMKRSAYSVIQRESFHIDTLRTGCSTCRALEWDIKKHHQEMMLIDPIQTDVLVPLLLKMFSPHELIVFLRTLDGAGDIAYHIPSRHTEPYWMFTACVEALDRRRLLERDAFYDALIKTRPIWKDDITLARSVLQSGQEPPPDSPQDADQARASIESARERLKSGSATERWNGWRDFTRALSTLQRCGELNSTYTAELSKLLQTFRYGSEQLNHIMWGSPASPAELGRMSQEELIELVQKEQSKSSFLHTLSSIFRNLVVWFIIGKDLKAASMKWQHAYRQNHTIPVPESVDILASTLVRWMRVQAVQLCGAVLGAGLLLYQIHLMHTDIQNQRQQLKNQELQIQSEQFESQEFRRTTLYRTLYSNQPCPGTPALQCPTFDRRSRQEAALALLRIKSDQSGKKLDWAGAQLSDVDLTREVLTGINLDSATLTGAQLLSTDLQGTSCVECDFKRAVLHNADLSGSELYRAHFEDAHLNQADLQNTKAMEASFAGANLTGADLTGADLTGADLTDADLTGATLEGTVLSGVRYSLGTKWPSDTPPKHAGAVLLPEE